MTALASSVVASVLAAAALAACDSPAPEKKPPPQRVRRVIEPSTERVGPLPPYAIRADGIGPYKLGDKLSEQLERLASGPRIALFEIPGVVHRNVIRAEDDAILIGGEQGSIASFVAVVGGDVARTESGIHVGSTRDEVIAALGPLAVDPERARDPRLVVANGSPSLRAVLIDDRVAALVVAAGTPVPRRANECPRPDPPSNDDAGHRAAGRSIAGACMTLAGELIEVGDDIVVRSADGERALAPPLRLPGVVFAAPLRNAADARDELVVVTRTDEPAARTWWLAVYRLEGPRLVRTVEATPLYQLSSANARWIGAELRDVELYLELTSRPDAIEVGGLLTTPAAPRAATKIRDVVVIAPASVARKRGKSGDAAASASGGSVGPASTSTAGGASNPGPGPGSGAGAGSGSARGAHVLSDATPDAADPADSGSDSAKP
jgi:hypothetical protein